MFKQTRTINLKFIGAILFVTTFLVGGFFTNTSKVNAEEGVKTFTVSYSMSSVVSSPNSDGGTTTVVRFGCAIGSGDLFDINTGKACAQYVTTSTMVGCAPYSKDLFDINTGKQCTNNSTPVLVGCAAGSGHIFDITTGKKCTNDTTPVIAGCKVGSGDLFDITTGKACKIDTTKIVTTQTTPILTINKNDGAIVTATKTIEKTIEYNAPILLSKIELKDEPNTQEESENRLAASAEKIGLVFKGPLSIWIILLICVILLSGGYGIYSFIKKDDEFDAIKPIAPQTKAPIVHGNPVNTTNTAQTAPQAQNLNKPTQVNNPSTQGSVPQNDPKNTHTQQTTTTATPAITPTQETLLKK